MKIPDGARLNGASKKTHYLIPKWAVWVLGFGIFCAGFAWGCALALSLVTH